MPETGSLHCDEPLPHFQLPPHLVRDFTRGDDEDWVSTDRDRRFDFPGGGSIGDYPSLREGSTHATHLSFFTGRDIVQFSTIL